MLKKGSAALEGTNPIRESTCEQKKSVTSEQKVELFLSSFRGRPDVHARRWENGGRGGYHPVQAPLGPLQARRHLQGADVLGIYPLLADNTTWWLAFDFDGPNSASEIRDLAQAAERLHIPLYLERSRSGLGYHAWLFFEEPVEAGKARRLGEVILTNGSFLKGALIGCFPPKTLILARDSAT